MSQLKKARNIRCPVCSEISLAGSRTCMLCGAPFDEKGSSSSPSSSLPPEPSELKVFGMHFEPMKAALWFVAIMVLYMLVFIAPLDPILSPLRRLFCLGAVTSLVSALLVWIDYGQISSRLPNKHSLGGLGWASVVLIAWPVGFPLYVAARSRACPASWTRTAYVISIVFIVTFAWVGMSFRSKYEKIWSPNSGAGRQVTINGKPVVLDNKQVQVIHGGPGGQ